MNKPAILAAAIMGLAALQPAHAFSVAGDLTPGGTFNGTVTVDNAWKEGNFFNGDEVDFWTFTAAAGDVWSFNVLTSAINMGMSLYFGAVSASDFGFIPPTFSNTGSFGSLTFVAGTPSNIFTAPPGASLLDITLAQAGTYTLAVGGEQGFGLGGNYSYSLSVTAPAEPEPEPVHLPMLPTGFLFCTAALIAGRGARRLPA
jgi:hypothetical protein